MPLDILQSLVWEIADQIARQDYNAVVTRCAKSRLTGDELRAVVLDYGRNFVSPPLDAYEPLDAVQVRGKSVPTWSVRAPCGHERKGVLISPWS